MDVTFGLSGLHKVQQQSEDGKMERKHVAEGLAFSLSYPGSKHTSFRAQRKCDIIRHLQLTVGQTGAARLKRDNRQKTTDRRSLLRCSLESFPPCVCPPLVEAAGIGPSPTCSVCRESRRSWSGRKGSSNTRSLKTYFTDRCVPVGGLPLGRPCSFLLFLPAGGLTATSLLLDRGVVAPRAIPLGNTRGSSTSDDAGQ